MIELIANRGQIQIKSQGAANVLAAECTYAVRSMYLLLRDRNPEMEDMFVNVIGTNMFGIFNEENMPGEVQVDICPNGQE